tara:strand:+ start:205 stop:462 length:258 start_codon:yes stop_codon:yes gene_type:complete
LLVVEVEVEFIVVAAVEVEDLENMKVQLLHIHLLPWMVIQAELQLQLQHLLIQLWLVAVDQGDHLLLFQEQEEKEHKDQHQLFQQ